MALGIHGPALVLCLILKFSHYNMSHIDDVEYMFCNAKNQAKRSASHHSTHLLMELPSRLTHYLMLTEILACWLLPVAADKHSDFTVIEIDFLLHVRFNLTYLRSIHYISGTKGLMIPSLSQLEKAERQLLINAVVIPGPNLLTLRKPDSVL